MFYVYTDHLKNDGIFVANISHRPDGGHYSIFDRQWWVAKFAEFNLVEDENLNTHFNGRYFRQLGDSHYFCFRKIGK